MTRFGIESSRNRARAVTDAECIGVELTDVDWEQSRVLIRHGKGEKERCVGLGDTAAAALRGYVQRFRTAGEGALFLTSAGQRMASAGTLEVLLGGWARAWG